MTILVSDTSVLIDLERGELISCAFKLSATFAVPDVLYERELRDYGGEELVKLGLKVESLDGDGVALAMRHMQAQRHLTVPDSFALALAKRNGWTLLTGDGPLRELAKAEGVDCHGVLCVSTGVILTHRTGVKVTHLGEDGSFAEAADVDPGASSGDTSHGPTGRRIEGDRAAGGVFA